MRKLVHIMLAILLVIGFASPTVLAKSDHGKESLVALGDSIPFGLNLGKKNNHPSKLAYPYLIGDEAELRVRNLGISGLKSGELLAALQTNQKFRQTVRHSDYVTLTIGNNDLVAILREVAVESGGNPAYYEPLLYQKLAASNVFGNIGEIIIEIRTLTDAPIVLYNVYNPFQLNDPLHYLGDAVLPQINAAFASLAFSFPNVYLANADSAFGDNQASYVIQGDVHPTAAGQQKLADIGLDALGLD